MMTPTRGDDDDDDNNDDKDDDDDDDDDTSISGTRQCVFVGFPCL